MNGARRISKRRDGSPSVCKCGLCWLVFPSLTELNIFSLVCLGLTAVSCQLGIISKQLTGDAHRKGDTLMNHSPTVRTLTALQAALEASPSQSQTQCRLPSPLTFLPTRIHDLQQSICLPFCSITSDLQVVIIYPPSPRRRPANALSTTLISNAASGAAG